MRKKYTQHLILLILTLSLCACSWHRKEIAFVKTSYYQKKNTVDTTCTHTKTGITITNYPAGTIKHPNEDVSYNMQKEFPPFENLAISIYKHNAIKYSFYDLDEHESIYSRIRKSDTAHTFHTKYTHAFADSAFFSGYYHAQLTIDKDLQKNIDEIKFTIVTLSEVPGLNNKREFTVKSNISDSLYLWHKRKFPFAEALSIPVSLIRRAKMEFLRSTSYQQKFLNDDSTLTQTIRIDSSLTNSKYIVSKKILNTILFEKNSKDSTFHEVIEKEYTFKEKTYRSTVEPPISLIEFRLDSTTRDTIYRKKITSQTWKYGRQYEYIIDGIIEEGRKIQDFDTSTPAIIYRKMIFHVDSNNRVHRLQALAIAENGDTLNLFETSGRLLRHKNGIQLKRDINAYARSYYKYPKTFPPRYSPQIDNYIITPLYYIDRNLNYTPDKLHSHKELIKAAQKREKDYRRYRKPECFDPNAKTLARSRKKGYEKRIQGSKEDSHYLIYEIYYKNIGRGNKLVPIN